jgi:hypothetical protein
VTVTPLPNAWPLLMLVLLLWCGRARPVEMARAEDSDPVSTVRRSQPALASRDKTFM